MTCFKPVNEMTEACDKVYTRCKRMEDSFDLANIDDINANNNRTFVDIEGNSIHFEFIKRVGISGNKVIYLELFEMDGKVSYPQIDAKNSSIIIAYVNSLLCD